MLIEEATSSPRLLKQLAPQKTSKSGGYSVEYDINEKEKYTQQFVITAERQKYTGGMLKDTITIVEPTHVTIYNPKEKKVTIEKRQGLNVRWRNPRELIFFFDVDRLEDVLSKGGFSEGAAVDCAGGRRVRIKYEDALSRPCLLEVDPSKNHLPVRLAELDLNDRMMRYHEVTLKRVDGIKEPTWFPESAMQISFFESVPVFTSSDKNFASRCNSGSRSSKSTNRWTRKSSSWSIQRALAYLTPSRARRTRFGDVVRKIPSRGRESFSRSTSGNCQGLRA